MLTDPPINHSPYPQLAFLVLLPLVSHMKQYGGINAVPSFNMMNEQLKCVTNIMNAAFSIFPTSYPFPAAQGTTITAHKRSPYVFHSTCTDNSELQ